MGALKKSIAGENTPTVMEKSAAKEQASPRGSPQIEMDSQIDLEMCGATTMEEECMEDEDEGSASQQ